MTSEVKRAEAEKLLHISALFLKTPGSAPRIMAFVLVLFALAERLERRLLRWR